MKNFEGVGRCQRLHAKKGGSGEPRPKEVYTVPCQKIFSPALLVILSNMRWHDPGLRAMNLQKIDAGSIQFRDLAGLMSSALTKDNEYQKQKIMNIKNKQEVKFNLCVTQVALILSTAPHLPNIFNEIRLQFWFLFCYMLKSGIIHIAKFHTYKK